LPESEGQVTRSENVAHLGQKVKECTKLSQKVRDGTAMSKRERWTTRSQKVRDGTSVSENQKSDEMSSICAISLDVTKADDEG
jgi:hypothetical protein